MTDTRNLETAVLESVSRSFYLSLRILPADARPAMGLGYLLCRTADTIADTATSTVPERLGLLRTFKDLFSSFPIPQEALKDFIRDLNSSSLTPKTAEGKLLRNFGNCAAWFNSMSRTDQALIQQVVLSVIEGMEMDLETFGEPGETPKALFTEKDLENYIQWIGGEPGRFWTNVCFTHLPKIAANVRNRDQWIKDGIVFGTGLQMVNILRDLPDDLKNGRCYLPLELLAKHDLKVEDLVSGEKEDQFRTLYVNLIEQTEFRLERGYSYLNELPGMSLSLRAAAGWPMLIGLKTLQKLRETPSVLKAKTPVKVKRGEIYRLMLGSLVTLSPICTARQNRREATRS